ncbi:TPA: tyrosine-type recombinase/integrase [Klebsiella pneumoniae]
MTNKRLYNNPRYTTKRGNTFYINFRLPDGSFFRQSLGTDSLKTAETTMARLSAFIPLVQKGSMSTDEFRARLGGMRELTQEGLDKLLLTVLEITINDADLSSPDSLVYQSEKPLGKQAAEAKAMAEAMRRLSVTVTEAKSADLLGLDTEYIVPAELKPAVLSSGRQVAHFHDLQYQAINAFASGDAPRYNQIMDIMAGEKKRIEDRLSPTISSTPQDGSIPSMQLSEAWRLFTTEKGVKWAATTANENQRFYDVLHHVVGDIPVGSITRQNIRQTLEVIKNLPRRNKKPYSGMTLEQCIELDVPEEDLISSANAHKHLKLYSSFFKVFLKDEKDILEKSPTDGIKYEVTENKGGSYSKPEMQRLVKHLNTCTDWRRDYFLTLIFTGARRGEIAAIRKEHLRNDEETGRWYIFIEDGKTEHAQRQIPLNRALEKLLLPRIKQLKPSDRVFWDLPTYEQIGLEWHSIMAECDIQKFNEFGQKRVIHALRHTFISETIAKVQNQALVQFCVGHSRTQSLGITARYAHRPPLKDLLPVVDCVEW